MLLPIPGVEVVFGAGGGSDGGRDDEVCGSFSVD
jgi:hypothetical protein